MKWLGLWIICGVFLSLYSLYADPRAEMLEAVKANNSNEVETLLNKSSANPVLGINKTLLLQHAVIDAINYNNLPILTLAVEKYNAPVTSTVDLPQGTTPLKWALEVDENPAKYNLPIGSRAQIVNFLKAHNATI